MFEELFRSWLAVLSRPSVAAFDRERSGAAMEKVLAGVALGGFVGGIGYVLGQFVTFSLLTNVIPGFGFFAPDEAMLEWEAIPQLLVSALGLVLAPLGALVGFFIWAGILFLVAKALGGPGDFVVHSYLLSLIAAPLGAIGGLLNMVFCLGIVAGLPLFVYQLVLTTLALQSAHGFTTGRAATVWLVPLGVLLFFACCVGLAVAAVVILAVGAE